MAFPWRNTRLALALAVVVCGRVAAQTPASDPAHEALALLLRMDFSAALSTADAAIKTDKNQAAAWVVKARAEEALGDRMRMAQDAATALAKLGTSALDADALVVRGSARLLQATTGEALADFESALQAKKDFAEAYAGRARVWHTQGESSKELSDLEDALRLDPQPLYYHNQARAFYDSGKYDQAVADLAQALALNARSYASFGLLGTVLARKGDTARALKAYGKAIALNADYAYAYLGRAALELSQGADAAGFQDLDDAVRIDDRDGVSRFNRAEAYWKTGRREEALADWRRVTASGQLDHRLALAAAERFTQALLWKEAAQAYDRAHTLNPGTAEPAQSWITRGRLALSLGRTQEAMEHFERALKLEPQNAAAYAGRAKALAREGKTEFALSDFDAAITVDPKSAEAYNGRGILYADSQADLPKALADFMAAVELAPAAPDYRFNLGLAQLKAHSYLQAVASFDKALNLKGPAAAILEARTDAEAKLGDQGAALRDAQALVEKDRRNPTAYDALAAVHLAAHDEAGAVRDLTQALALDPKSLPALLHRGGALGALGDLKAAVEDFKKAAKIDEGSSAAWTGLCTAQRLNGDFRAALASCSRALEIDEADQGALIQRGLSALHMGKTDQAVSDLSAASRLGARRAESLLGESYAHVLAKQYKEAHKAYRLAMDLDAGAKTFQAGFGPSRGSADAYAPAVLSAEALGSADLADPDAFVVRADALRNAGQTAQAIQGYTKAMELDGTLASAYVGRGICLFSQDSQDAAHQDFLRAIELAGSDIDAHLRLATLLTAQGRDKEALDQIAAALKLDPKNAQAYWRAGNVRYFEKDFEKALENYKLAVKNDGASAVAHNGMGMGYFALRRYREAIEEFSHAAALAPFVDLYRRNRASAYVNLRQLPNAIVEYRSAAFLNTDPVQVGEYQKLIQECEAH